MFGPSIAYNEHRVAPALSALGKRDGAEDERKRNRNAARNGRAKLALCHGPAQPAPAPKRLRTAMRVLQRQARNAVLRGDAGAIKRIAAELGILLARATAVHGDAPGVPALGACLHVLRLR
jgi:hypothetical protein